MHRVELKAEKEDSMKVLKYLVPNAPCGVESQQNS